MRRLRPGDQIALTGAFLRNTGQHAGPESQGVWTVVECGCGLCKSGRFVATDQPAACEQCGEDATGRTDDGAALCESCASLDDCLTSPVRRHFAAANVYRKGTLDARNAL